MSGKNLPPATPTRALLKRVQRRSSLLPPPPPDAAASATKPSASSHSRRTSLQIERKKEIEEEEEPVTVPEEDEEKGVWNEVGDLLDTVQRQNDMILDLERRNRALERDVQNERSKPKSEKGLTKLSAIQVEREFLSQEMILKGLQRDNEEKTVEVENLRRRVKTLSEFLAKLYGEDHWQSVVMGGTPHPVVAAPSSPEKEFSNAFSRPSALAKVLSGSSSPVARARNAFPTLGQEAMRSGNPFTSDPSSSPSRQNLAQFGVAPNNDDEVIPTIARMQTPLASPTKQTFGSAATDGYFTASSGDAAQPDFDPQVLLASIEGVRLLVQGFERRNAMRRTELEEMIDRATLAEERVEKLKPPPAVSA